MKSVMPMLALLLSSVVGLAQDHHAMDSAAPFKLSPEWGNLHHPIATKNQEAQKMFDQGLTLVYAFNHEEAARSFRSAAALDPQASMPWWGIALAVGPNYNLDVDPDREKEAYQAIQKARTLAANGPPNEQAYVEALAKRYSSDPKADMRALAVSYKNAMRDVAAQYPEDLDAATLYAESMMDLHPWQLWTLDGKPGEDTAEVVSVLQSVLKRDPRHMGANHYYIHAVEASSHPEQALASAQLLQTLAPAAGHLAHMPAHIYERTGDYAGAVKANQAAVKADRAYLDATGNKSGVYAMMYFNHNLHFLALAASMEGNFATAKAAADQLVTNVTPGLKDMPMLESFLPMQTYVLVRFGRWDDVARLPAPEVSLSIARAVWHYARGMGWAAKGDAASAQAEAAALTEAIEKQPVDALFGFNKARAVLGVALEVLNARIAAVQGDRKTSIDHWRKAVAAQDAFVYDEPPDWYYPVRESLGAALALDGQNAEAETVFRADLERNPNNPRSLFGLVETLKVQKKKAAAKTALAQFDAARKNADTVFRMRDL